LTSSSFFFLSLLVPFLLVLQVINFEKQGTSLSKPLPEEKMYSLISAADANVANGNVTDA